MTLTRRACRDARDRPRGATRAVPRAPGPSPEASAGPSLTSPPAPPPGRPSDAAPPPGTRYDIGVLYTALWHASRRRDFSAPVPTFAGETYRIAPQFFPPPGEFDARRYGPVPESSLPAADVNRYALGRVLIWSACLASAAREHASALAWIEAAGRLVPWMWSVPDHQIRLELAAGHTRRARALAVRRLAGLAADLAAAGRPLGLVRCFSSMQSDVHSLLGDHASAATAALAASDASRAAGVAGSVIAPLWHGEPLAGRTVFVPLASGLGDQLRGLRAAASAAAAGARVVVACDRGLAPLVEAAGLAYAVVAYDPARERPPLPRLPYDFVVEAGSHAALFGSAGPQRGGYLALPPCPPRAVLDGVARPRVGLVWAGNPGHVFNHLRSMPLEAVDRLVARTPGVSWVSCYVGHRAGDLAATPALRRVRDAGATFRSMLDTARVMQHLDLVVTVDSSPCHLAGALGVPVWTLLGQCFDWQWATDRETTPLYPSMRLIRDADQGDWTAAVDRVARDLAARFGLGAPAALAPAPGSAR